MALNMPGSGGVSIYLPEDQPADQAWSGTFGSFLPCMMTEDGPARVTGVELAHPSEAEPVSAVVYVRTFDSSTDSPIASMRGEATDLDIGWTELREGVAGLEVGAGCVDAIGFDGELTDELLISVTADQRGAHVSDVTVSYITADGDEHAVQSGWDFYLCGSEVSEELCNPS
jgi:hypothetical protein